jgi:hypothetical protein
MRVAPRQDLNLVTSAVSRDTLCDTDGSPELDQEWPDSSSKPAAAPEPRRSTRPNLHRSTGDRFKVQHNGIPLTHSQGNVFMQWQQLHGSRRNVLASSSESCMQISMQIVLLG